MRVFINLTPLIPLSNQQDGISPADKYVWRGGEILRGVSPLLDTLSILGAGALSPLVTPHWGRGGISCGISLRYYEGGRVGKDNQRSQG